MISFIRRQMSATNLMVLAALIFAMAGGAYAAGGGGKHHHGHHGHAAKKHKGKAKGKRGPRGKQGPAGPAGPAGPIGPTGAAGKDGATGLQGPQGVEGKEGPQGPEGEAGMCSAGNTECALASGANLMGTWGSTEASKSTLVSISFPVRVSPAPTAIVEWEFSGFDLGIELGEKTSQIVGPQPNPNLIATQQEAEEDQEAWKQLCPGSAGEPTATPGYLCVYVGRHEGTPKVPYANPLDEPAHEFGIVMPYTGVVSGSWAVTAE